MGRSARSGRSGAGLAILSDRNADVAQLVEHHLAKVRVAGSNPVVRSEATYHGGSSRWSGREARQRPAKPCTRVQIPSPPRVGCAVKRGTTVTAGDWRSGSALP